MRKFLLPVINIVNLILVGIAFGLGGNTAIYSPKGDTHPIGNYYQVIWNQPNVLGLVAFFLFVVGVFLLLVTLVPFKGRKFVALVNGGMLIASGILTLGLGNELARPASNPSFENSGSLIAFTVLLFIAGGLAILIALLELFMKKED